MTMTVGMRCLVDHLAGDRRFKVARDNHDLDRTCVQFAMVADMERWRGSTERWVKARSWMGVVAGVWRAAW